MQIRRANLLDLNDIIKLLHDDILGKTRESVLAEDFHKYQQAFLEIAKSDQHDFYVMEKDNQIVGCYQIMFLAHLNFMGTKRAQVETVMIRSDLRGQGLGRQLINHAINLAEAHGCGIFQLTSNKDRVEANRFYNQLGLQQTHNGYKLYLSH